MVCRSVSDVMIGGACFCQPAASSPPDSYANSPERVPFGSAGVSSIVPSWADVDRRSPLLDHITAVPFRVGR
jgi:hypothetical protein